MGKKCSSFYHFTSLIVYCLNFVLFQSVYNSVFPFFESNLKWLSGISSDVELQRKWIGGERGWRVGIVSVVRGYVHVVLMISCTRLKRTSCCGVKEGIGPCRHGALRLVQLLCCQSESELGQRMVFWLLKSEENSRINSRVSIGNMSSLLSGVIFTGTMCWSW